MTLTIAEGRAAMVQSELLELDQAIVYAPKIIWSDVGSAIEQNQVFQIPEMAARTVQTSVDATTGVNATNLTIDAQTVTSNTLTVREFKVTNEAVQTTDHLFTLGGTYVRELAKRNALDLANARDQSDFALLCQTTAYDSNGTYHVNVASDSAAVDDVETAAGLIQSQLGIRLSDLVWMCHPMGVASIRASGFFSPLMQAPSELGLPMIGTLDMIPLFVSQNVPRRVAIATSAVSVTSNVATATVVAGHGFVPGMMITNAGLADSATNTSAVAITSVGATSIVFPYVASNGAQGDGVGTLTDQSCWNMLCAKSRLFQASVDQAYLPPKIIEQAQSTAPILRVENGWGRVARAGGVYVLHTPALTT